MNQTQGLSWRRGLPAAALCLAALLSTAAAQAQSCSTYQLNVDKGQALYLLFPTGNVWVTVDGVTYPMVGRFDVADLDPVVLTDNAWMRNTIHAMVRNVFCELSVDVKLVLGTPTPFEPRYQIVGIGSDESGLEADPFGRSYVIDVGDQEARDFSRVWGLAFYNHFAAQAVMGFENVLQGSRSTPLRWARTIAGTVVHEAAHNYGLDHEHSAPVGFVEDSQNNHAMASSGELDSPEYRADRVRHFSDTSYEILGHNIGLNTQQAFGWDFVNPNDVAATRLTLRVLAHSSTLEVSSVYDGPESPWGVPSLTPAGTEVFQGKSWFAWDLVYSTPKAWNGPPGTVPPGAQFHVGAGLSQAHLLTAATLGSDFGPLQLQPRMAGYNYGMLGNIGDYAVIFFDPDASANDDFTVSDVKVDFLPRLMADASMTAGAGWLSSLGLPVEPFARQPAAGERPGEVVSHVAEMTVGETPVEVTVARLSDRRHVDLTYVADPGCEPGIVTEEGFTPFPPDVDMDGGEIVGCPDGTALSLFPATYTYVTGTVVDPDATYWDAAAGGFVTGPLESRFYVQVAGTVPDLNGNGVDDLLDLRNGTSRDEDGNGVPDEAQGGGR